MTKFQLSAFSSVAFTGCRKVVPVRQLELALSRLSPSAAIAVGCAAGVDQAVRDRVRCEKIFRANDFGGINTHYVAKLALRSTAMVEWVRQREGVLISFPSKPCPEKLLPKPTWPSGHGSGTWSTTALAIGLKMPVLLWTPQGEAPDWGFETLGGGWHVWQNPVPVPEPSFLQLALLREPL